MAQAAFIGGFVGVKQLLLQDHYKIWQNYDPR